MTITTPYHGARAIITDTKLTIVLAAGRHLHLGPGTAAMREQDQIAKVPLQAALTAGNRQERAEAALALLPGLFRHMVANDEVDFECGDGWFSVRISQLGAW